MSLKGEYLRKVRILLQAQCWCWESPAPGLRGTSHYLACRTERTAMTSLSPKELRCIQCHTLARLRSPDQEITSSSRFSHRACLPALPTGGGQQSWHTGSRLATYNKGKRHPHRLWRLLQLSNLIFTVAMGTLNVLQIFARKHICTECTMFKWSRRRIFWL